MALKLPPCPTVAARPLPGLPPPRLLAGEIPTLATQLVGQLEGRDNPIDPRFFESMGAQPLVEYAGVQPDDPPRRFPLPYTDVSMVSAAFAVPLSDLAPLLPATRRLRPARVTPWHAVLFVYACHHHRSGLGRYQELGIAVPMLLEKTRLLPGWSLLRELLSPGSSTALGFFPLEMPVDRQRPAATGIRLAGLPQMVAHAEFALGSQGGLANMELGGMRLAALEVSAPRSYPLRQMDLSFNTYSLLDGHLVRTRTAVLAEGYRGSRGIAKVEFGEHPRFARFRSLRLLSRPLETRVCPRQNWIVGSPEDLGPA
jgi:hypothetical protein